MRTARTSRKAKPVGPDALLALELGCCAVGQAAIVDGEPGLGHAAGRSRPDAPLTRRSHPGGAIDQPSDAISRRERSSAPARCQHPQRSPSGRVAMRQITAAASDANVGRRISSVNHRVAASFTASVEMNRTCAPTAFAALTTCRVASTIVSQSFAYAAWTTSVGSTFAKAAATPVGSRRSAATQTTPATARRWVNATTHSRRLSECSSQ